MPENLTEKFIYDEEYYTSDNMTCHLEIRDVQFGFFDVLEAVLKGGNITTDDTRGSSEEKHTIDVHNLIVDIKTPLKSRIPINYIHKEKYFYAYAEQLLDSNNPGFDYTYGERLFDYEGLNQINNIIIPRLKHNPHSRQAIATIPDPQKDSKLESIPCMQSVDFKNINDELCLTAYFRSHDIWGAWPINVYGLSELLAYVSGETGIPSGNITTISSSSHIYQRDWNAVLEYLYRNNEHLLNIWKGVLRANTENYPNEAIA